MLWEGESPDKYSSCLTRWLPGGSCTFAGRLLLEDLYLVIVWILNKEQGWLLLDSSIFVVAMELCDRLKWCSRWLNETGHVWLVVYIGSESVTDSSKDSCCSEKLEIPLPCTHGSFCFTQLYDLFLTKFSDG